MRRLAQSSAVCARGICSALVTSARTGGSSLGISSHRQIALRGRVSVSPPPDDPHHAARAALKQRLVRDGRVQITRAHQLEHRRTRQAADAKLLLLVCGWGQTSGHAIISAARISCSKAKQGFGREWRRHARDVGWNRSTLPLRSFTVASAMAFSMSERVLKWASSSLVDRVLEA